MTDEKGAIRLRLSAKELGWLLCLPEGFAIERLNTVFVGTGDSLDIIVSGQKISTTPEGVVPRLIPTVLDEHYVNEFDENRTFLSWYEMLQDALEVKL